MLEKLKFWEKKREPEKAVDCEDCENQIPPARLKAVPGTTVCVACLSDQERNGGGTVKHRMEHSISFSTGGEIDSVEQHVVKSSPKETGKPPGD